MREEISHAAQHRPQPASVRFGWLIGLLATAQVVWFYLASVPGAMDLVAYEQGTGPMPFQGRMLLRLPLRWAHNNSVLQHLALAMSAMPGWFGRARHPEGVLEAVIDTAAVAATCWVARRLYRAASPQGLLTPYILPLTLVMVTATYAVNAVHPLRFVYDLPSLGLFSLGLEIIFFRRSIVWFAALFSVATVNRETSLFLLLLEGLTLWSEARQATPTRGWQRRAAALSLLLCAWLAWHAWVAQLFAANPTAAAPRLLLNAGTILCPIAWPQLLSVGAFCGPLLVCRARRLPHATLRAWRWIVPIWLAFMLIYGLLIETRIFGELIAYLSCSAALLVEQQILGRLQRETADTPRWNPLSPQAPALSAESRVALCCPR